MKNKGHSAFNWLDHELNYAGLHDNWSQDEVHDWLYMMVSADWEALDAAWSRRSIAWKRVCTFVLGLGPSEGQSLLKRALCEDNIEIVITAAISLSQMVMNASEDAELQEIVLDQDTLLRLRNVVEVNPQGEVDELKELVKQIDQLYN